MARRHHYRRRTSEQAELDMTTFLNLMVVLVPFLLITAVFSRITIVELSLPSGPAGSAAERAELPGGGHRARGRAWSSPTGASVIATLPKVDGEYDLERLTELTLSLKRDTRTRTTRRCCWSRTSSTTTSSR